MTRLLRSRKLRAGLLALAAILSATGGRNSIARNWDSLSRLQALDWQVHPCRGWALQDFRRDWWARYSQRDRQTFWESLASWDFGAIDKLESPARRNASLFLANLASGCSQAVSVRQRIQWADRALEASQGEPWRLPILKAVGLFLYQERQWDRAVPVLEEWLEREPSDGKISLRLGISYVWKGDYEPAVRLLRTSGSQGEEPVRANLYLAIGLHRLAAFEESKQALQQSQSLLRSGWGTLQEEYLLHYYRGLSNEALERSPEAERAYLDALRLRPGHGGSLSRLTLLYIRSGRPESARQALERVPLRYRNSPTYERLVSRLEESLHTAPDPDE